MTASDRPSWLDLNYCDPQVQYPLIDLCPPGAVVFDVGANFGHLSVVMSRQVGPRGAVCAFEANPNIVGACQQKLIQNGCGNAQVYHAAVFAASGHTLPLYLSDNEVSDSIKWRVSERSVAVKTLALDDFVRTTGLAPALVKMDIEGAEGDALRGFQSTIDRYHPILIIEQRPDDDQSFEILSTHGYQAIDLRTYRLLEKFSDLPIGIGVTDILYAVPCTLVGTAYELPFTFEDVATLSRGDFELVDERTFQSRRPLNLKCWSIFDGG